MTVSYAEIAANFEQVISDIITELGLTIDLVEVVSSLPTASANTMNKLYLVAESTAQTQDAYQIFVTVRTGTSSNYSYAWEKVDSARIDLSTKADAVHAHGNITSDGKLGTASRFVVTGSDKKITVQEKLGSITLDGKIGTASGKIITTGTGGVLQASDTITKSKISDFPSSMTPASHTHGSVTNDGKIGSASGKIITTGTGGALQASDSITKSQISDFPTSMTPTTHTHTKSQITDFPTSMAPTSHTHGSVSNDGKIGTASGKIITTGTNGVLQASDTITKSQISDFPTSMTPASHTHGSITDDGKIGSNSGKIITTGTGGVLQASDSIGAGAVKDSTAHSNIGSSANDTQATINTKIDTALGSKVAKSSTPGLLKNDGTVDTNSYLTSASITGKQDVSNLVTSFSSTTSDSKYPSEKLVKNYLDQLYNEIGSLNDYITG